MHSGRQPPRGDSSEHHAVPAGSASSLPGSRSGSRPPGVAKPGTDVTADVVAESGDLVYESGILKGMQCVSCGLAGHAVVGAETGDRGRGMTGCEFSCGDALSQCRGDADVRPQVCPVPVTAGCWGCSLITN